MEKPFHGCTSIFFFKKLTKVSTLKYLLSSKKLQMVEKWPHISCKRFSRYILTKIAKIGKFALYSFIYLQVVPAFNGVGQVTRNIIKPTFISFPVKSWGSELTHLATHTFNQPSSPITSVLSCFYSFAALSKIGYYFRKWSVSKIERILHWPLKRLG